MNNIDMSLIVLTYKGKILLMNKNFRYDARNNTAWTLIGGISQGDIPFEEIICGEVEKVTSIKLKTVELLSSEFYLDRKRYFFQAKLTDDNVNKIKREDGQTLAFFTYKELNKLELSATTKLFLLRHRDVLEKTPN